MQKGNKNIYVCSLFKDRLNYYFKLSSISKLILDDRDM